jgi:uncharacterized membrane protein
MTIAEEGRGGNDESIMPRKVLMLFVVGFFLTFVGIVILTVATILYGEGSASFGALVFIGPIPIVVGAGSEAAWMVLFAIILAVLSVIMFLMMRRGIVKKNA